MKTPEKSIVQRIKDALFSIGEPSSDTGPPKRNDAKAAAVDEMSTAAFLKGHVERRYESAKDVMLILFAEDIAKVNEGDGKMPLMATTFSSIAVSKQRGAQRIDRALLFNKLIKDKNMTADQASAFIDACLKRDASSTRFECIINNKQ